MSASVSPASILILVERSDRWFSTPEAYAELMRVEGINDVEGAYFDDVTPDLLAGRAVTLVGPGDPSPEMVKSLIAFAYNGGGLICCSPGEAFAAALGLDPLLRGLSNCRIEIGQDGYPDTGLPIKGWSSFYTLKPEANCTNVLPLKEACGAATGFPALIELSEGDGVIVVLSYDPAMAVYLLRQGNPMLAGCRSSGFSRMRPSDLFDRWQDPLDAEWPVADLHCHFLRETVQRVWPGDTVLPWLWYFPDGADTLLTFTSDDDWSTKEHFERLLASCESHRAGLTLYLVQKGSVMDRAWLEALIASGFDFSIHPDLPPPTLPLWENRLADHVRQFQDTYGRPPSGSVRNHCITWSGYLDGARIEARQGFSFDTNYFSLLPQGKYFMNGAGLPMRFVDTTGDTLGVFQLPTQFSDETTLVGPGFPFSLNLTADQGIDLITGLINRCAGPTASMMCVNAHPVSFATYSAPLWEPVLQFARDNGIPVWDVERFNKFWQNRRSIRLRPIKKGSLPDFSEWTSALSGMAVMLPETPTGEGSVKQVGGKTYRMIS